MIDEVDGATLAELVANEDRAVLFQFWGTWCAPRRALKPHLARLADDYADGWRMVALNVDKNEASAAEWDVYSLPTLVLLRGGEELHRFAGAVVPSQIAASLDELSLSGAA